MTILENEEKEIRRQIEKIKEQRKKLELTQSEKIVSSDEIIKELRLNRLRVKLLDEKLTLEKKKKTIKWKKRLKQASSTYEIFLVIEKAPEEVKEKAWEKFLERNPDKHDLDLIITFAPEKYKTKAQEVLQVLNKEIYV